MAVAESAHRFQDLRLDTGRRSPRKVFRGDGNTNGEGLRKADHYELFNHDSALSEQMRRVENAGQHAATPPMSIPTSQTGDDQTPTNSVNFTSSLQQSPQSSLKDHWQNRRTSISFDPTLKLDSGARHRMEQPLQRSMNSRLRDRSPLQATMDDKDCQRRPHSESGRSQYDPVSGEHLPHNSRKEWDRPHIGESRHPLLPATVDELARGSQTDLPALITSGVTVTPSTEQARIVPDAKNDFALSPVATSPIYLPHSYDERSSYRRYNDRSQTAEPECFGRASGSLHKSSLSTARQAQRRSVSSTKSPRSAASSYLASFSASRRSRNGNGDDCFDASTPSPDGEGQTIGDDYVLGKQIGFGGFSIIREAFRMNPDGSQRRLAVKIVRRNIKGKSEIENEQAQAEFEHEFLLWRPLKHPHILPLEIVLQTDDATFCFIPLNQGGTLFDLVHANRSGLPPHLAKRYTYQLATAIRFLHEDARIAHRDIKLENCLLDTTVDPSNVRLCDFGMAEWITNDYSSRFDDGPPSPDIGSAADRGPHRNIGPSDTSSTAFAGGSLEYAAPEILHLAISHSNSASSSSSSSARQQQREAGRGVVNPASDIWALGVCIYTLIVGSRPFQDSFQPRVSMAIMAGRWDRERLREKGGEEALELVAGCLEMDIGKRWDINGVLASEWLREEAERDGGEGFRGYGGGWGL